MTAQTGKEKNKGKEIFAYIQYDVTRDPCKVHSQGSIKVRSRALFGVVRSEVSVRSKEKGERINRKRIGDRKKKNLQRFPTIKRTYSFVFN
jgi:hypothetical protein